MALPAPGLTLADKQTITRALLHSGASIKEMNLVRRHLSALKGGKLATMAQPARIVSLIISDVPGDDPTDVASGPTVADNSAPRDALRVLQRYGIAIPKPVSERLNQPAGPVENAATGEVRLIATPAMALAAAGLAARQHGLTPYFGDAIEGESRGSGGGHGRYGEIGEAVWSPDFRACCTVVRWRNHGDSKQHSAWKRGPQYRVFTQSGLCAPGGTRYLGHGGR